MGEILQFQKVGKSGHRGAGTFGQRPQERRQYIWGRAFQKKRKKVVGTCLVCSMKSKEDCVTGTE